MTNQLLIYQTAVPVSRSRHATAALRTGLGYGFTADVNSVPAMTVEFPQAAAEYPLVFSGQKGQVMPAVILGLRDRENLFVSPEGIWRGSYIPAFIRRYPFVFSREGDRFVLCVDESYPGFNRDSDGERLFDPAGEPTEYTRTVLKFMEEFQAQFVRTQAFCTRLEELDLLEPTQAEVVAPSGARTSLRGFTAVNRPKLKALPAETLASLMASDHLELIFLHLQSLRNFEALKNRFAAAAHPQAA